MGWQIILKDNNKFAVWSTGVDDFILDDATKDEVIDFFAEAAYESSIASTTDLINRILSGLNPYFQFKLTYKEAVKLKEEIRSVQET